MDPNSDPTAKRTVTLNISIKPNAERKFVFRMKRDQNVIACRLIPADGQTWQTAAKRDIANFLSEWLPATDIIW